MRILITSDWYIPAVNGVVTSVLNLTEALTKLGHEVRVLTLSSRGLPYREGNVYYVPSISGELFYRDARIGPIPDFITLNTLEKWQPDIIHSQCELSTFVWAKVLARHYRVPVVHTYHTMYEYYTHYIIPSERIGHAMVKGASRFVLARTNMVIVPTAKVRQLLVDYGVSTPIRVVPTGIKLERFLQADRGEAAALRLELCPEPDKLLLVTAGRVTEEKNMHGLLRLLAAAPHKNMRLAVVGDGPYRSRLEELSTELGLEDTVTFVGMVPQERMPLYYALGDVYVSASQSETQGLTYVEAMAAGLPMLCMEDGSLEGLVQNGVNGWQFTGQEDFEACLARLQADPELRTQLAENARRTAEEGYSTEVFARRVLAVYEETLTLTPVVRRATFRGVLAAAKAKIGWTEETPEPAEDAEPEN